MSSPRLFPSQVCFVVDDVPAAVQDCVTRFGWGPFQQFSAPVDDAEYRGWRGRKLTDVALGMAGSVQVELIHVHEGHDAVEAYQAEYGRGFQHLGVGVRSRDEALRHLEAHGGVLNSLTDYADLKIAFVDLPTGPAMFELLESNATPVPEGGERPGRDLGTYAAGVTTVEVDRATIVCEDMDRALRFHAAAFRWDGACAEEATLRHPGGEARLRRFLGRAGTLELELIEARPDGADPYAAHLRRGAHGLVHAGGPRSDAISDAAVLECEWLESAEHFGLYPWAGGETALQLRNSPSDALA